MNYQKRVLKKATRRVARLYQIDFEHLPTEQSLQALEAALKHWPDFMRLMLTETSVQVALTDQPNKLGRPWSDEELQARLVDLACKTLTPQGAE